MKKILLFVCLLILGFQTAFCQQRNTHQLFWFRLAFADTITTRLKWELYMQRRTQNTSPSDQNIFNSPQFKSYWLWFTYSLNKNVKIAASPFGYFESHVLNNSPTDVHTPPIKEFRWCARVEHEIKGRHFNYINRYNLEYRRRDLENNGDYQPNWRIRYMIRFDKAVKGIFSDTKPVTFTIYDEVFLQFGKAVKNNPNVFDQNRIYLGAAYEVFKNIKLNLGYIYGFQERNSGEEFDNINTYWIVLTFDNLVSQFKSKNSKIDPHH